MKTLCSIHHLFYMGSECPLCRQERVDSYRQRFCHHEVEKPIKKEEKKNRVITDDDINKLINKFNSKRK